ncbi:ketoacyl-ACP synthase III [Lawsonibacter sp. OA9]|uniref:beta-ketoacyl-ACP synthase III n=1 Tax=Oscillospiraceae TaxID=216572 RepID=UPI001F061188|nr:MULTISPECIES: beta-ketoacyl-ACP synthase III [Oscillospiraceae]MCH1978315.1 ketoacyl-ACP synthase III [Lawsonibacter sp. OA9]MCH1981850.1 ketoacyl-ACP synthase III [Ruminococcus sp. OA3]
MRARILGTGSYLPEHIMTNDDIAQLVDTSDEWIRERTGIKKRHLTDQGTVSMAAEAVKKALEAAATSVEELDMILFATVTPDYLFPSAACQLQDSIGAENAVCMDINAACSGFVFALNTAASYIQSGIYGKILVVGAETLSKIVDWEDRSTCILFGDGAGAAVVGADETGIECMDMGCDGSKGMVLYCEGNPLQNPLVSHTPDGRKMHMDGQAVFKFAIRKVPETIRRVLEKSGTDIKEIDHFIMHQANRRILASAAKALKIPNEKMPMNMDGCGNIAAASIPILLDEYSRSGKIKKGDKLILCAFGGGLSWGSTLMTW